jgi:hypothetical protein
MTEELLRSVKQHSSRYFAAKLVNAYQLLSRWVAVCLTQSVQWRLFGRIPNASYTVSIRFRCNPSMQFLKYVQKKSLIYWFKETVVLNQKSPNVVVQR